MRFTAILALAVAASALRLGQPSEGGNMTKPTNGTKPEHHDHDHEGEHNHTHTEGEEKRRRRGGKRCKKNSTETTATA